MNSNSKYIEDACRNDGRDSANTGRRPQANPVFKCGVPGFVAIPALEETGSTFTASSLTVNNTNFCNPCTKLEFTSNINVPVGFTGTLSFQVFKQCRNQLAPVPVGPAFIFARVLIIAVGESNTFSFFVCDCDSCNEGDCCTYSVVVTNLTAVDSGLTITNATLAAITENQSTRYC